MATRKKPPVSPIYVSLIFLIIGTIANIAFIPLTIIIGIFKRRDVKLYWHYMKHLTSQGGGVLHSASINLLCFKKGGWKAGSPDESVSSCFGKNYELGKLTLFGKAWYWVMDKMDPNHSLDAIEDDEGNELNRRFYRKP